MLQKEKEEIISVTKAFVKSLVVFDAYGMNKSSCSGHLNLDYKSITKG